MDARQWLEQVRGELNKRKLPPFYAERLVDELSDHLNDLLEDRMSTDAKDLHGVFHRPGSPATVAKTAAGEFRKQRFSRRHPVLTFVVMPVVALALLWATGLFLFLTAAGAISWLNGGKGERFPEWLVTAIPVFASTIVLVPIALTAAWFCRVAGRAAVSWKWPLGACLVLAIVGGAAFFDLKMSPIDRGVIHGTRLREIYPSSSPNYNGHLMFGFGLDTHPKPWQILQFSVPLAICGCFIWRQVSQRRQHVLTN